MIKCTILFILLLINTSAVFSQSVRLHKLERIYPDDEIYKLTDELYLSSGELPPSQNNFTTLLDIRNYYEDWKRNHTELSLVETNIAQRIESILNKLPEDLDYTMDSFYPSLEVGVGVDYLYHEKPESSDSLLTYFDSFKDRDFVTKYDYRKNYFDIRIKSSYWDYFYFYSQFALKESWNTLNEKNHYYPKNFHEIDDNFNLETYFIFRYKPITIISGRDWINMGPGRHGKLLISNELPPLDNFKFAVRFGDHIRFFNFISPLNNIYNELLSEDMKPKYLLAHRLEFNFTSQLRVSVSELLIINSYLKWNYLNPLNIYHNMSNSGNKNILSAIDVEWLFPKNIKSYLTIAIDEIDFYAVEEYSGDEPPDKNRLVAGYQLGTEIYNLFRVKGFNLALEGVFLDKWLYNYPNDGSRDLTYTYYDKVSFPEKRQFYRFIGHYLGSNAAGLFIDLSYKNVTLGYQYIDQGEVFIFEPAFSEREEVVSEYKNIFLCQFKNQYLNDKIEIAVNLNYSNIQNYHNQKGVDTKIPEFWINFRYRLLYLEDIFY